MIKRILTLFLLIIVSNNFAQLKFGDKQESLKFNKSRLFYSIWQNPKQFDENFILNYKVPYDQLIFEKTTDDTFLTSFKIQLEIKDEKNKVITRQIDEVKIKCTTYEQTISKNLFYSNFIALNLPQKKLSGTLTLLDIRNKKEIPFGQFKIDYTDTIYSFTPIFIKEKDITNIYSDVIKSNFSNALPYSPEKYVLLLPYNDRYKKIRIKNSYVSYEIERLNAYGTTYSIFPLDTLELYESRYSINFQDGKNLFYDVIWFDKPEYLFNFEKAVKIMEYIFSKETLRKYKLTNDKEGRWNFYMIWKTLDPTPQNSYNELLAEFYRRADFASREFQSISQPDGVLTDRGKIYIVYGSPTTIVKSFSNDGRAIETWKYEGSVNLQFVFFDVNKNGNFILQK